jgi:hypothetical protein
VAPAVLAHGVALIFLFTPLHEAIHRTAFRSHWLNDVTGWITGFVILLPPEWFRQFHFAHHRWTQDPARDPELSPPKPATMRAWLRYATGASYWIAGVRGLITRAIGKADEPYVGARIRPAVVAEARLYLYTSHLMEEVQEISDRVAIMDHGEVIALGTVGELIQKVGEEDRLIFNVGDQTVPDAVLGRIKADVAGVTSAAYTRREVKDEENAAATPADGIVTVYAKRGRKALPDIIQIANEAGLDILSVSVREPDLEAVFLHLTGRALRD